MTYKEGMDMRIVMKFGGTSLMDTDRVAKAAGKVADEVRRGRQVAVVVSAQGHTTDALTQKALAQNPDPSRRELDVCLTAGEQVSAALFAMALEALGVAAVSLTGAQAGIFTDGVHGDARIREIDTTRLERELAGGRVCVVTGFQGAGPNGDITTLGRGGSDTSAVALAAWLGAEECRIYTDVDGVYDRDPRLFPDARKFSAIGYDAMLSLIDAGAQVLHRPCVELAKQRGIRLEVLSSFRSLPGTVVGDLESSYPSPA